MIQSLDPYHKFFTKYSKYHRTESTSTIFLESDILKSKRIYEILSSAFNLQDGESRLISSLRLTLSIPSEDISIELALSTSQTTFQSGTSDRSDISAIEQYNEIPTIKKIFQICSVHETIEPEALLALIKQDTSRLDSTGFRWELSLTISKDSIIKTLRAVYAEVEPGQEICVFIGYKGLFEFLKHDRGVSFYELGATKNGSTVIFVGNINCTISGPFLVFTELWEYDPNLENAIRSLSCLDELRVNQDHIHKIAPPGVGIDLPVPTYFRVDESNGNDFQPLVKSLSILQAYYELLVISNYAFYSGYEGIWTLRMIGSRTFQSEISFINGKLLIDDDPFDGSLDCFHQLCDWIFSDSGKAKVSIAQRTATLHSSNYCELIEKSDFILRSSEAAHELYIHEMVSEVMEVRQRFSEYLLDWSSKDVESRVKLDDAMNLTVIGGLSTIIASTIALATQSFDPVSVATAWQFVPLLILLYLLGMFVRIFQTRWLFSTYLNEHMRQISFYTDILGIQVVQLISGSVSKTDLENDFLRKRKFYLIILTVLILLTLGLWLFKIYPVSSIYF